MMAMTTLAVLLWLHDKTNNYTRDIEIVCTEQESHQLPL